ncbi:encore protein, partial [Culex quinquefasciatus]
ATDKKDDALSHHHHQNQQHHHAKMNNSVVHQHQTQAVPLVSYSNSATPNSGCYTINY